MASKQADNPAQGIADRTGWQTTLPKVEILAKLIVPSWQSDEAYSILGLGDLMVPGLLIGEYPIVPATIWSFYCSVFNAI